MLRLRLFEALGSQGRALAWLMVAFACVIAPHFEHIPLWATGLALAAFALKLTWIWRGTSAPSRWLMAAFGALAFSGVLLQFKTILGRDAGVTLLVILACIKLLEMRVQRDVFVVLFLAFFIALCQFFFSQSLGTALWVLTGITLLFTALIADQLALDSTAQPLPWRRLLGMTLRMYVFAVPLAIITFLLFPRFGPLWGNADGAYATTGMSDTMSPGSITQLAESDALAFRVKFDTALPAPAQRYWRAWVLGRYDGRTWREYAQRDEPLWVSADSTTLTYTITLEGHSQRWLPLLDLPTQKPRLMGVPNDQGTQAVLGGYQAQQAVRERIQIQATSAPAARLALEETRLSLQPWLELPASFNPRTLALAAQWQQRYADDSPAQLAARFLLWLRTEPFRYTLAPPPLGIHAMDDFLFNTRAGFCEHYASALVVFMRALDIPARVVVGYQGGTFNRFDNHLEVRQSDAHAWAEIWLTGQGWVRIDPTAAIAPERIERGATLAGNPLPALADFVGTPGVQPIFNVWRSLRQYADAINHRWNQSVINYNRDGQRYFFQRLGIDLPEGYHLWLGLMSAIGVISLIMAWRLWGGRTQRDPLLALYLQFEIKLRQAGLQRDPHEGPARFRQRALHQLEEPARQHAERIFDAWIQLRYQSSHNLTLQRQLKTWIAEFRIQS